LSGANGGARAVTPATVYVVIAASGEYEDYRERRIAAFMDRSEAEQFAADAYAWTAAAENHRRELDVEWHDMERWRKRTVSPYDEAWETGENVRYHAEELNLLSGIARTPYTPTRFRKTKEPVFD
jgi:hypothetical protein